MRAFPVLAGILATAVLAACATGPETTYRISAAKAEYRDAYYATKRACEADDGYVVVHGPLRHRNSAPDFRTLYWCSRRLR